MGPEAAWGHWTPGQATTLRLHGYDSRHCWIQHGTTCAITSQRHGRIKARRFSCGYRPRRSKLDLKEMRQGLRLTEGGGKMGFNLENKLVTDLLRNTIQPWGGSDAYSFFCIRDLLRHISASDLWHGGGLICTLALYLSKVRSRTTCFLFSLEWDSARFRSHSHKNGWLKVNLKEIGLAKCARWNLGDSHKSKGNNHTSAKKY